MQFLQVGDFIMHLKKKHYAHLQMQELNTPECAIFFVVFLFFTYV